MRHLSSRLVLITAVLLLAACVLPTDMNALQADVNNLKKDSYQNKKSITALDKQVASLQKRADDISATIPKEESLAALRSSQTSLYSQVSNLLREVQTLRGRFDEYKYYMDKQVKQTSADIEIVKAKPKSTLGPAELIEIKSRLDSVESNLAVLKGKISAIEMGKEGPTTVGKKTPDALYDDAYNTFNQKSYAEARQKWEVFLKDYPDHKLASNSFFWIGETHYMEKNFAEAILSYENVIKKFSDSTKVPAAMLKQAYAFLELGDKRAAKGLLKGLIGKYPKSNEAKIAKKKLEKIK
jgi:tol-pal system protein YbgF